MNYELCLQTGSAVLAHFMLNEKLQKMGMLGCLLCVVGSTMIVLHAPLEESLNSVQEIWVLATQPGMLLIPLFILVIERSLFWFLPSFFFWFPSVILSPAFLLYVGSVVAVALVLILYCAPRYGQTNILIYIGICSVIGSLTVSTFYGSCSSLSALSKFWFIPLFLKIDIFSGKGIFILFIYWQWPSVF